ncbi:hypothetical protein F4782DRAFT_197640 [Xylaria castorea]|nr:hypothetical protein F4782DRAFT_197640 [Xylaria castorea]
MENPVGEFVYYVTSGVSSAYKKYQKVVFKIESKPNKRPPHVVERSAEWFTNIMADMITNNNSESSEELVKEGEDHHGSQYHATVEGYAEENSDWLLVGHERASHEQTHSVDPVKETRKLDPAAPDGTQTPSMSQRSLRSSHPPDSQDTQSYNGKKHRRYIQRFDGTEISGNSQQSDERNCPRDLEDVDPNDCNNKCTHHPSSGADLLMSMEDEQTQAEMDILIAGLKRFTVSEFQTTIDGGEQPELEGSASTLGETTAIDDADLSSRDHTPEPAGEVSNPPSSLPFDKMSVTNFLGVNLKAKVQGWKNFFKQQLNKLDGQQAETSPPAHTGFEDPYRYYTLVQVGPDSDPHCRVAPVHNRRVPF